MKRPGLYLLGYREYTIEKTDMKKVVKLFLNAKISVKFRENSFCVSEWKSRKIDALLSTRVKFTKSEPRGMYGFVYKNRMKYGAMVAMLLITLLSLFLSDLVWDVRVVGVDSETAEVISGELSEVGFSVGKRWSKTDKSDIEVKLLDRSGCVSWININRRGAVAYVEVIKKNTPPQENKENDAERGYANVVAKCDGVIEEITVLSGIAKVRVGDVVKKGDLLISGVLPEEVGGGFCYAKGNINARVFDTVSVSIGQKSEEKIPREEKTRKITLKIFDFSLNIFKSYRNFDNGCAIIEKRESKTALFSRKLPLTLVKEVAIITDTVTHTLSEDEMTKLAGEKMRVALASRLVNSTLYHIRTDGSFADGEYRMVSYVIASEDIGATVPFSTESKG